MWGRLDENSVIDDFITANIAAQAAAGWKIPLTLVLLTIINRIRQMRCGHRPVSRNLASAGGYPDPQAESR